MLKSSIRTNAGAIWEFLAEKGTVSVSLKELCEQTGLENNHLMFALGWLAKENKVKIIPKDKEFYAELVYSYPDRYY